MTNYEANNSSGAPQTAEKFENWSWLTERLPPQGLEKLDDWLTGQLCELESSLAHMVSARSLKRDQRYQFAQSER
jgi:hypothetical protein